MSSYSMPATSLEFVVLSSLLSLFYSPNFVLSSITFNSLFFYTHFMRASDSL
jgi:hypothetical protein